MRFIAKKHCYKEILHTTKLTFPYFLCCLYLFFYSHIYIFTAAARLLFKWSNAKIQQAHSNRKLVICLRLYYIVYFNKHIPGLKRKKTQEELKETFFFYHRKQKKRRSMPDALQVLYVYQKSHII